MSFSPALANRQRILAAIASGEATSSDAAPAMPSTGPAATEYELLLMSLGEDLRRLSSIQSTEGKIAAKPGMIGAYLPWVEGALEGKPGVQDDVVATMLVWALDIADWDLALRIGAYMLDARIVLPVVQGYKRPVATFIAEEAATAGLAPEPTIDLETLVKFDTLTADHDMYDQVRAKLYKAVGLALQRQADAFDPSAESAVAGGKAALLAAALAAFRRALALDSSVGVKKAITALESALKKLASEASPEPT